MTPLETLFDIDKGHQLALNRVQQTSESPAAVAYVARSHRNNGITAWVEPLEGVPPASAGTISVCLRSRNHSLSAFVQPRPYYTTYHVAILTPKKPMSLQEKLWWCLCIRANRFRFHFGRQANRTIGSLLLPDQVPAWAAAMELPSRAKAEPRIETAFDSSAWKPFLITDLFTLSTGPHTSRGSLGKGSTPLVSASEWNNGITAWVAAEPHWKGGQITVANNGSIGAAFYQARPFTASRDVTILQSRVHLDAAAALFVCAVLRKESERFNYARKWTLGRMRETTIKLPAKNESPDFAAMAAMMKSLPLGWFLS